jgi:tetratricopeptide (TPR) repeat protein
MKAARPLTPPPPAGAAHVPTARGTLGATPLAHVLVYMLEHALTGTIVFREPEQIDHVLYFQLGAVSKVQIARPTPRLGDELVASGLVARATINEAVEGARRLGVLLGEFLVGHDLVTRDALTRALEAQIANRVAAMVNLPPETTYSFYRDVDFLSSIESEGVASDPINVILATVRAWHDRVRIRATLTRIDRHPLVFHDMADPSHLALTSEERKVVDFIREAKPTTSALFQKRVAEEEPVSSLLYALAVTRQFAFKGQKGAPMGGQGAAIPISIAPPAQAEAPPVEIPVQPRAPTFSDPDFADDLARASGLPPMPAAMANEELRSGSVSVSPRKRSPSMSDAQPPSMPPGTLSERPAPMGAVRTNSEVANAERALEAMTHCRLAEAALDRGDLAQAERLIARAVISDPGQTDYIALHAWIRALVVAKTEGYSEAIHTLSKLLADDADCERALMYRGKLLKKMNRMRESLRDFERVLKVNPRHREATQEVRLLKQRSAK